MHLFFLMEIITNLFSRDSKQLEATTFLLFPPPSSLSLHIPLHPSIILRYAYLKKLVTTWLKKIHLVFTGFHNLASFHNINCTHMCYGAFFFSFLQMAYRIRTSDPAIILHKARFQFDRHYVSPHSLKKNTLLCLHVSSQQLISKYGHWCMTRVRVWNRSPIVGSKWSQLYFL